MTDGEKIANSLRYLILACIAESSPNANSTAVANTKAAELSFSKAIDGAIANHADA